MRNKQDFAHYGKSEYFVVGQKKHCDMERDLLCSLKVKESGNVSYYLDSYLLECEVFLELNYSWHSQKIYAIEEACLTYFRKLGWRSL